LLDDLFQPGAFFQQFLGFVALVPETGPGDFRLQFSDTFFFDRQVKDTPSAHRAWPEVASRPLFHHET